MDRLRKLAVTKLLYGLLFVGLLPLLLVIWAAKTRDVVALRTVHSLLWGLVTAGVGVLLMVGDSVAVAAWRRSADECVSSPRVMFPAESTTCSPTRSMSGSRVSAWESRSLSARRAGYGWYRRPWSLLVRPWFSDTNSPTCMHDSVMHFQNKFLPPDDRSHPTPLERSRCYLTVLWPWFILYEAVIALGIPADAKLAYLPFESRLRVWPWTEILYGSVYVVMVLVPLKARTRHALRWFSSRALLSMVIVSPCTWQCR